MTETQQTRAHALRALHAKHPAHPLHARRAPDPDTAVTPLNLHVLEQVVESLSREYEGMFSPETVERYVFESYSSLARTAKVDTFLGILTEHFANDRLRALAKSQGKIAKLVPHVLFVCAPNIGRSQMAAALLAHAAGDAVEVRSAGITPGTRVHPLTAEVLRERGVELTKSYPKPLTDDIVRATDYVVTIGHDNACPIYPDKRYLDWDIAGPDVEHLDDVRIEEVRGIVDQIEAHVHQLWAEIREQSRATEDEQARTAV
ncbi:arsenate reductase ArsC [Brevibacterium daeguense]|uniref:Arsenate reductase ArsC n=1 Tax=Brevibacterium daeguense TaxID=909936 RepID=A0ABP8EHP1_9MICO|nr:arsenate reductase ArsC [Brevibacterium daeguense]